MSLTKNIILIVTLLLGILVPIIYSSISNIITSNMTLTGPDIIKNDYEFIVEDSDGCKLYSRNSTIDDKLKRVWIKSVYSTNSQHHMQDARKIASMYDNSASEEQTSKIGKYLDHKAMYVQFNCSDKSIRMLVSNLMDGNNVLIKTVDDKGLIDEINLTPTGFENQTSTPIELVSGPYGIIYDKVCKPRK